MKVFKLYLEFHSYLNKIRENKTVAFVPTMGSLHQAHLDLVEEASKAHDIVVCSIFVNPRQFNNVDDYTSYPRDIDKDIRKLQNTSCTILYSPKESELYNSEEIELFDLNNLDQYMEGEHRPGHFQGVVNVIDRFFALINPESSFFGQKDIQQLMIIKHFSSIKYPKIKIIGVPTIRDKSGLAMSSRNKLLSNNDLKESLIIYRSLLFVKENHRLYSIIEIKEIIFQNFQAKSNLNLDYFEIVSIDTLHPIKNYLPKDKNVVCIAATISNVRLIDNIIF
ncbi:MAG: pantoate--beta-alanine ligase [Flavobacteriales bacterium]|nr:pantoate--beta-alanine ligase [Flavobacteriales bacterium]|tara:strand:- start:1224 stop:2060 length:837 start_codon:yes stop_codon:yes gene_type:complete